MVKNTAQFQGGLSLPRSPATCGTEEQRRLALFTMRRPQGFRCPKCGHKHCSALQSRKLYRCRHCRFQVSETQGAIFASIKLLLPIWMLAIYLLTQSTLRAASSFSLYVVPVSTGDQRLPADFISSATPRSTGYIGLPEFSPGPFVRQAVRPPAVACCFSWQFPHSVFCAGH